MPLTYQPTPTRTQVYLTALFMGPTGSGKTRGALELAFALANHYDGLPVNLINSERRRAKMYADRFPLAGLVDLSEDGDYSPEAYVNALDLVEDHHRGGIIVVDSATHEWAGKGGVLQLADRFGDWKVVRPRHQAFVDRLLACESHLIVTVRAKMKYEVGEEERDGRKRQVITMLGVGPIQDSEFQYEFNLVARFDQATKEAALSGHVDPLEGKVLSLVPPDAVAAPLAKWLSEGDPPPAPEEATAEAIDALRESLRAEGFDDARIEAGFVVARRENRGALHPGYVDELAKASAKRLEAKAAAAKAAEPAEAPAAEAPAAEGEPAADPPAEEPATDAPAEAKPDEVPVS